MQDLSPSVNTRNIGGLRDRGAESAENLFPFWESGFRRGHPPAEGIATHWNVLQQDLSRRPGQTHTDTFVSGVARPRYPPVLVPWLGRDRAGAGARGAGSGAARAVAPVERTPGSGDAAGPLRDTRTAPRRRACLRAAAELERTASALSGSGSDGHTLPPPGASGLLRRIHRKHKRRPTIRRWRRCSRRGPPRRPLNSDQADERRRRGSSRSSR